jgi:hypothetical protein
MFDDPVMRTCWEAAVVALSRRARGRRQHHRAVCEPTTVRLGEKAVY